MTDSKRVEAIFKKVGKHDLSFAIQDHKNILHLIATRSIPDSFTGCWNWSANRRGPKSRQYSALWIDGISYSAHRLAFVAANKRLPIGDVVRHKCDNTVCVNPGHLEEGTIADNNWDMVKRGRQNPPRGEKNIMASLNEQEAIALIRHYNSGKWNFSQLGRMFNVTAQTATNIVRGKTWKHLELYRIAAYDTFVSGETQSAVDNAGSNSQTVDKREGA